MIGEIDLAAELGVDLDDEDVLVPLRLQVVVASAAAGLLPPLGPVSPDFRDLAALATGTARLRRMGFGARPAIHPAQVPVFNQVLGPDPDELAEAGRLIELYERGLAAGRGVVLDDRGRMIDEAAVRVARRILGTADRQRGIERDGGA
jgi:citrate lyase subunit beta/citryl-CoA lyase